MKANLFVVSLLLIVNSLIAQNGFSITINQDDTGLFTVSAKSNANISQPVLGSAQITLVAPEDGLVVSDLVNHTASWNYNLVNTSAYPLEGHYVSFALVPGETFYLENMDSGKEFKLFSFRNTATCIGPIRFIDPNFTPTTSIPINLGIDFSVVDLMNGVVYQFIENYGITEITCEGQPDTISIETEVVWINNQNAIITWQPILEAVNYTLEARLKGANEWDSAEIIKVIAPKTYFYGLPNMEYEYRLNTNYENGDTITSTIFPLVYSNPNSGE